MTLFLSLVSSFSSTFSLPFHWFSWFCWVCSGSAAYSGVVFTILQYSFLLHKVLRGTCWKATQFSLYSTCHIRYLSFKFLLVFIPLPLYHCLYLSYSDLKDNKFNYIPQVESLLSMSGIPEWSFAVISTCYLYFFSPLLIWGEKWQSSFGGHPAARLGQPTENPSQSVTLNLWWSKTFPIAQLEPVD